MYERFTERARQAVTLAIVEARSNNNTTVSPVHLLAGLVGEEEGIACRVLESLGVNLDVIRSLYPRGSSEDVGAGAIPLSQSSKSVVERAVREALTMGHNYVGTEHLLLAIIGRDPTVAAVLHDPQQVREAVTNMLVGRRHLAAPPPTKLSLLDQAVELLRTMLEHGFHASLTSFGQREVSGRTRAHRFRLNVLCEDPITHSELLALTEKAQDLGWQAEFSQKHGLTFRPQDETKGPPTRGV